MEGEAVRDDVVGASRTGLDRAARGGLVDRRAFSRAVLRVWLDRKIDEKGEVIGQASPTDPAGRAIVAACSRWSRQCGRSGGRGTCGGSDAQAER
jgi:hypothetical protein